MWVVTALKVTAGLGPQLARFSVIGVTSTLAYNVCYVLLRTAIPAQTANLVALLATTVGNTALNRRITFGVRGRRRLARHQAQGLVIFAIGLGLTSVALAILTAIRARPPRLAELTVVTAANLVATAARFVLLRGWVFRSPRRPAN